MPDGKAVGWALRDGVAHGYDVIITTGGTGLSPSDDTPEQTRPLLDKEIPHLAAAITAHGVEAGVPTAVLSRGLAGLAGRTLIVNLPGSRGGAAGRDGRAEPAAAARRQPGAGRRPPDAGSLIMGLTGREPYRILGRTASARSPLAGDPAVRRHRAARR